MAIDHSKQVSPLHLVIPSERDSNLEVIKKTSEALREIAATINSLQDGHAVMTTELILIRHEQQRHGMALGLAKTPSIPPMRQEAASSNAFADYVVSEADKRIEAEKENPLTPAPDAEKVTTIRKEVMAAAIMQLKSEMYDRQQKLILRFVAACITTALAVGAFLIEHFFKK